MSHDDTPETTTYLARVARELRADRGPRIEERVTPIAAVQCGRREITVELVESTGRAGVSARLTVFAPAPGHPGATRMRQDAWMFLPELSALIDALERVRGPLQAKQAARTTKPRQAR